MDWRCVVSVWSLTVLACGTAMAAAQRITIERRPDFLCYYEGPSHGVSATLHGVFSRMPPSSTQAEGALRSCLKAAIARAPDQDILATAWFSATGREGDERIVPLKDGSRHLSYTAKTRAVQTWNERQGIKTTSRQDAEFLVQYEETPILTRPGEKFATVKVLFMTAPPREKAYEAILVELKKAVSGQRKKLRTSVYAFVGDRANPAGQKQIMDDDGAYIFAEYDPVTGQITRRGKVLGSLSQ